uniref:Uncharacterized protein n=1 Tax=Heliothis virescens TaxID=7102 RepID=A0A2A4K0F4_HELVI
MKIALILIITVGSTFTAPSLNSERIEALNDASSSPDEEGLVPAFGIVPSSSDLIDVTQETEDALEMNANHLPATDVGLVGPAKTSPISSAYHSSNRLDLPTGLYQEHISSRGNPSEGFEKQDVTLVPHHSIKRRDTVWLDTAHAVTHYKVSQDYPKLHQGNHHVISKDYPEPNLVRVTLCDHS